MFFLGDFLNPALVLLGQGLKKSPIGQKLDFANHSYWSIFKTSSTTFIALIPEPTITNFFIIFPFIYLHNLCFKHKKSQLEKCAHDIF
jgi:hypothetical protein